MTTSVRFDRLESERLILRRWQESDEAPFAELNADPETTPFFPNTLDRAASDALIEMIETRFDRQGFPFWAQRWPRPARSSGSPVSTPLPRRSVTRLTTPRSRRAIRSGRRWRKSRHPPGCVQTPMIMGKRRDKPAWRRRWKSSTPKG